jgi:hypothetical protein
VAGAAQGIGAAFARGLARRGLDVVLVDRLDGEVDALARALRREHGVAAVPVVADLASRDVATLFAGLCRDHDVGLVVCNAASSPIGPFLDAPLDDLRRVVDLNCGATLAACHVVGRHLVRRGRGGIVVMSSMSAFVGSPLVATYAASKAFDLVLAEALWDELRGHGVDVVACAPGPTDTPGYRASAPRAVFGTPPASSPALVAERTLAALGRGPTLVPGRLDAAAAFALQRLLPRRAAVALLGRRLRAMYAARCTGS